LQEYKPQLRATTRCWDRSSFSIHRRRCLQPSDERPETAEVSKVHVVLADIKTHDSTFHPPPPAPPPPSHLDPHFSLIHISSFVLLPFVLSPRELLPYNAKNNPRTVLAEASCLSGTTATSVRALEVIGSTVQNTRSRPSGWHEHFPIVCCQQSQSHLVSPSLPSLTVPK
jgi:hypothetical protein